MYHNVCATGAAGRENCSPRCPPRFTVVHCYRCASGGVGGQALLGVADITIRLAAVVVATASIPI